MTASLVALRAGGWAQVRRPRRESALATAAGRAVGWLRRVLDIDQGNLAHGQRPGFLGRYAEDMRDALGVGDGRTIHVIDMMAALLSAVQALSAKVERLEKAN